MPLLPTGIYKAIAYALINVHLFIFYHLNVTIPTYSKSLYQQHSGVQAVICTYSSRYRIIPHLPIDSDADCRHHIRTISKPVNLRLLSDLNQPLIPVLDPPSDQKSHLKLQTVRLLLIEDHLQLPLDLPD